jgi:hypothetical protein
MVARKFLWPVCFWDLTLKTERLINVAILLWLLVSGEVLRFKHFLYK